MTRIVYGFIKPTLDAHTLGITTAADLLTGCGYQVIIGDAEVSLALNEIQYEKIKRR